MHSNKKSLTMSNQLLHHTHPPKVNATGKTSYHTMEMEKNVI